MMASQGKIIPHVQWLKVPRARSHSTDPIVRTMTPESLCSIASRSPRSSVSVLGPNGQYSGSLRYRMKSATPSVNIGHTWANLDSRLPHRAAPVIAIPMTSTNHPEKWWLKFENSVCVFHVSQLPASSGGIVWSSNGAKRGFMLANSPYGFGYQIQRWIAHVSGCQAVKALWVSG